MNKDWTQIENKLPEHVPTIHIMLSLLLLDTHHECVFCFFLL